MNWQRTRSNCHICGEENCKDYLLSLMAMRQKRVYSNFYVVEAGRKYKGRIKNEGK
jgi:ArsR family metal-binding transcriptional regulator